MRQNKYFCVNMHLPVSAIITGSLCTIFPIASNINSVPLPTGSGARAIAQGSAFIAVVDGATAASRNPGALTQL
ncbi:MAG: hypothetical protein HS127_10325 [Planctomycetia bacterium]|nr:hypothetical protein [Planctomycetia bacterium]